jgi:hypothetical protein
MGYVGPIPGPMPVVRQPWNLYTRQIRRALAYIVILGQPDPETRDGFYINASSPFGVPRSTRHLAIRPSETPWTSKPNDLLQAPLIPIPTTKDVIDDKTSASDLGYPVFIVFSYIS